MERESFANAQQRLRHLAENDNEKYLAFRRVCSDSLSRWYAENAPEEGMGSSDVSCHMIETMRYWDIDHVIMLGYVPE